MDGKRKIIKTQEKGKEENIVAQTRVIDLEKIRGKFSRSGWE